jgi:hypothetical protein
MNNKAKKVKANKWFEEIIVIDDAIPVDVQASIENYALSGAKNTKYIFLDTATNIANKTGNEHAEIFVSMKKFGWLEGSANNFQLVHTIKSSDNFNQNFQPDIAQNYLFGMPFVLPVLSALPHTITSLGRIKINLVPYQDLNGDHGIPHIDSTTDETKNNDGAMIAIYYVNDADGDTIIYNQTIDDYKYLDKKSPLTVKARVAPKKGRIVVFSGKSVHSAGLPKKSSVRSVININYIGIPRKL